MPLALGIETSCDDTSVSLTKSNGEVLFLEACGQNQIHSSFGGIVPELASRNHGLYLLPLIEKALKKAPLSQIDIIAFTSRPGLLGSLLVGFLTGKTLGLFLNKPFLGVNHIEGHIFSSFLRDSSKPEKVPTFPFLALIVSGSHTHLYLVKDFGHSLLLGATLDDAAGEALDKFGKMLEFSWPGGPQIDEWAKKNTSKILFFSKIQTPGLSFSFSGIKSAGRRLLEGHSPQWLKKHLPALCDSYQQTIVRHLMEKLDAAWALNPSCDIAIGGGVSANSFFRKCLNQWAKKKGVKCFLPEKPYCTDNAAMIAYTGIHYFLKKNLSLFPSLCSPNHLEKDFFKFEKSERNFF